MPPAPCSNSVPVIVIVLVSDGVFQTSDTASISGACSGTVQTRVLIGSTGVSVWVIFPGHASNTNGSVR